MPQLRQRLGLYLTASLGITFRQAIHVSGKPWRKRTGRPRPPET